MAVIDLTPARLAPQVNRGPQAPTPSMAGMAAAGAALERVGEQLAEVERVTARARQADLVAQGQARYLTGLADLRGRLEQNDPAFASNPVEAFSTAAARLRDEVAGAITDRAARTAFERQASLDLARDRIEVIRFSARRTAESSRAQLDQELDTYADLAVRAPDAASRTRAVAQGEAAIIARVNSGALAADAGERARQGFVGRLSQAEVLRDINSNPALALRRLAAGEYRNLDPVQQERLANQARTALQTAATVSETELRRREAEDRRAANEAEKAFRDAVAAGNTPEAQRQLGVLRQRGQAGQYASAADQLYGLREPPTTPQMEAWVETRLRARDQPLTRDELERARADRSINDTVYRRGIAALSAREDVRFREAEAFTERALEVPSAATPANLYTEAQREAVRRRNAIVNDLVLERQRNPDVDPLAFVRERLSAAEDPGRAAQRQAAETALRRLPAELQTPEGLAQVRQQWADYQRAVQNRGWFSGTPTPPRLSNGVAVTGDMIGRWSLLHEQAGMNQPEGARR